MADDVIEDGRDIHAFFGLTYSNYLVLPRTLLQSMPEGWQKRFVLMVEELDAAFDHIEQAQAYKVEAATVHELGELSPEQLRALGITEHDDMDAAEIALIPCADPVPHYNRGRTHIPPRLPLGWLDGRPVPALGEESPGA